MRDKEKARQYDLLYRKQHKVAIRIKQRLYRKLPHVRKRICEQRQQYLREYYQRHREERLKYITVWAQANKDKMRLYKIRYKERLKEKQKAKEARESRTFNDILKEYLEYAKDRFKEHTVYLHTLNLGRFSAYLKNRYGDINIAQLTKEVIIDYVKFVNSEATNKKGLKLNQSEKGSRLYPLKKLVAYLYRKGYIEKDLLRFIVVPPAEEKAPKRTLTPEEMARLLEAPDQITTVGIRHRAMLEVLYSGLRIDELFNLKVSNVDLNMNKIDILESKEDKDRTVPMTGEAIYWVGRWLSRRSEYVKNRKDSGILFITQNNTKIRWTQFAATLDRYTKKANIDMRVRPHDIRRATATHLAQNGAPIRMIQALLGHASLAITSKYLRIPDEKIKTEHKRTHPSNRRRLYYGELQR